MNTNDVLNKLIAEIERRKKSINECPFIEAELGASIKRDAKIKTFNELLSLINSLQQEQLEVDLEKFTDKIKTFQERYKYPEVVSIKGAMAFMARMFYQYPNVARQWYDSLPKATMD